MMFSGVIGAKYFTAVGTRNLERRLNRVKAGLDKARADLKREHDRQAQIGADEEMAEMRVRFMKELMQDLKTLLQVIISELKYLKELMILMYFWSGFSQFGQINPK